MQVSRVIRQVARPLFSVAKPSFIIPAFSYSSKASSAFGTTPSLLFVTLDQLFFS